jgi:hypothetical protein
VTSAVRLLQRAHHCAGSMTTNVNHLSRPLLAGLLALGLAVGLSACSGSHDAATGGSAASSSLGAQWGNCIRSAGFSVDDPSDDEVTHGAVKTPAGVDQDRYRAAADKCARELGVHRPDAAEKEKWARQYDQVASCIRDAFPDFPEQQPGSIGWDSETYPTSEDPSFEQRAGECMQKYAPDTKTQHAG